MKRLHEGHREGDGLDSIWSSVTLSRIEMMDNAINKLQFHSQESLIISNKINELLENQKTLFEVRQKFLGIVNQFNPIMQEIIIAFNDNEEKRSFSQDFVTSFYIFMHEMNEINKESKYQNNILNPKLIPLMQQLKILFNDFYKAEKDLENTVKNIPLYNDLDATFGIIKAETEESPQLAQPSRLYDPQKMRSTKLEGIDSMTRKGMVG
jgi:hypothetical protein